MQQRRFRCVSRARPGRTPPDPLLELSRRDGGQDASRSSQCRADTDSQVALVTTCTGDYVHW